VGIRKQTYGRGTTEVGTLMVVPPLSFVKHKVPPTLAWLELPLWVGRNRRFGLVGAVNLLGCLVSGVHQIRIQGGSLHSLRSCSSCSHAPERHPINNQGKNLDSVHGCSGAPQGFSPFRPSVRSSVWNMTSTVFFDQSMAQYCSEAGAHKESAHPLDFFGVFP
jgi:hypothetical protein